MRGLEGQGHLLWGLEAGLAETCPGAAEHLELQLFFLLPGFPPSPRPPPPPPPPQFWRRGPDKATSRSTPAQELARGLTDARNPHHCLDPRIVNRGWGRVSNYAPPCTTQQAAAWPPEPPRWTERLFCAPGPVLRFDKPLLSHPYPQPVTRTHSSRLRIEVTC